jgi:hypothetical protein
MRGYLEANRLSAMSILPDPWFTGERMYRTGDLLSNPIHDQAQRSFNGASRVRQYSGGLIHDLNARVRETGTTQHQLVLSATTLILQWLSGEHDLVLGAPDSGRRSTLEREACG